DLDDRLPPDAGRLRLTSGLDAAWDEILLAERVSGDPGAAVALAPSAAIVAEISSNVAPATPSWTRAPRGWCTTYGDALALMLEADEEFVILAPGDELRMEFDGASLPAVPNGQKRDLFLRVIGWRREVAPRTPNSRVITPSRDVAPSTTVGAPAADDWMLRNNQRWSPAHRSAGQTR
ncbi:MAG: hypothetical protein V3T70_01965, partial [Phycisphaerae bacterium]